MAFDRPNGDGSQRTSPRAFLIQYLTLMLIILSFMVGSFVTKAIQEAAPAAVPTEPMPRKRRPLDTFTITALFSEGSAQIAEAKMEALRTLFLSHDLGAEVRVYADADQSGIGAVEQAVARALSLKRALEVEGIPSEAIRVFGVGEGMGPGADITLIRTTAEGV